MLLLCTDLDRTLIPNGREPESPAARQCFRRLADASDTTLVYVTGRDSALVEQAIDAHRLPWPDYLIGDVGTSLFTQHPVEPDSHAWQPVAEWDEWIARGWPGASVLRSLLEGTRGLHIQEAEKQTPLKLSYYVALDLDEAELLASIRERLTCAGFDARLVWSIDETASVGLLDLLPVRAGKYRAIDFLRCRLGCYEEHTVFAGDSGNDLDVLTSPLPAVLVANAEPEVRAQARQIAADLRREDRLYCASGGWQGMNGNYAAGILEGVAHFRPDLDVLLDLPA
jgi:sucrose-6-phosphatase